MTSPSPAFNGQDRLPLARSMKEALEIRDTTKVREFLAAGGDINSTDSKGNSILAVAAMEGDYILARDLIEKGANLLQVNCVGYGALYFACKSKMLDIVQLMLDKGVRLEEKDYAYVALERVGPETDGSKLTLVKPFVEAGMSIDATDGAGNTALHLAVIHDNMPMLVWLIEHGANMEVANDKSATPLIQGVLRRRADMVEVLLEHGANPYVEYGGKPLEAFDWANDRDRVNAALVEARKNWSQRLAAAEAAAEAARSKARKEKIERYDRLKKKAPKFKLK